MNLEQKLFIRELWLAGKLTSSLINEEWEYFQENARKFPENSRDKRYGILPMGATPSMDSMLYNKDVTWLRCHHLHHIATKGSNDGHKVRIFIDWLEKAEGKRR